MMETKMARDDWHLDKKTVVSIVIFCIGLFFAGVGQTIYITSFITTTADKFDSRISALEKSDSGQESHENRIVILEQQFNYIRADLAEIKDLLRRQLPVTPQQ
jgi:5-bromo-4-chloroindolyl phosphate hydrolysis protein